jgi:glycosyltransferase involved in cell wall biosynthesis
MDSLHILHLISTLGAGGAENHLFLLARAQKRRGHQVEVAYFRSSGNLTDSFLKEGIPVHYLAGEHYLSFRALVRLRKLLKKKPDVVHTHLFSADLYGSLLAPRYQVSPLISSKHNQDQYLKKKGWKTLARWIGDQDQQIIAISDAVQEFNVKALGYSSKEAQEKFTRIYYGIDLEELDQTPLQPFDRKSYGIPEDALIVGTIGRLSPQKGYAYWIEAFAQLRLKYPQLYGIAVGRGEQEAEIRRWIEEKNLKEAFFLVGYHSERSTLLGFLQAMDIFVLSSLWEGFGLVLAEAMAFYKPIVATTAGSIPEVVTPDCGYLVPPKEVQPLVEALEKLICQPELRKTMGKAGRKRVENLFSVETMVQETEQLYRRFQR